MKILMESTPHVVTVDGIECRIWNGVTESNTQCFIFVHRIAVRDSVDQKEVSSLLEQPEAEVMILTEESF